MMSERFRHSSGVGYTYTSTTKMENDFSPKKTMIILVIVVGCFAVLWPKVFYPMLVGSANQHMKPSAIDRTTGCCYVLSEIDVDTIKIMSELCGNIIKEQMGEVSLTGKQIIRICQDEVLKTCGIDISAVLQEQVRLGQTTKDILDQVRSLNGSLCLKYNFGVAPWRLGVPHIITLRNASDSVRQERPAHVRSEMLHPAFKERGRAIPQTASPSRPPPKIIDGRPGPIPSMRPTMGGAGHVAAKQGAGSMGVIMPIYTIGIVVFFTYTLMKIIFKKHPDTDTIYSTMEQDVRYRKDVLGENGSRGSRDGGSCKLGDVELDQLRRRLRETEMAMERVVAQMAKVPLKSQDELSGTINLSNGSIKKDEKPSVKIMAMETSESCEGGKKWQSVNSSVLPNVSSFVNEYVAPPQEIYLDRALPPQSQILVTDSATETQSNSGDDPAVVLAGKMTLSVISLENENIEIDEIHNVDKHEIIDREISDNSKQRIEEEINNIIEEAIENVGMKKLDLLEMEAIQDKPVVEFSKNESANFMDEVVIDEEIKNENIEKDIISKPSEENGHITLPYENLLDAKKLTNEITLEEEDNIIKENELFQTIEKNQDSDINSEQVKYFTSIEENGDIKDPSAISGVCNKEDFSIENALHIDSISEKIESSQRTSSQTGDTSNIALSADVTNVVSPSENNDAADQIQFSNGKSPNGVKNEFETASIQLSNFNSSIEPLIAVSIESSTESDQSETTLNKLLENKSSNKRDNESATLPGQLSTNVSSEIDETTSTISEQLSNDGCLNRANEEFKIAHAKSLSEFDEEFKTSHAPPLIAKSSSEDSGSTANSVSNQGSVIDVSTRHVENESKSEEEQYVSEEEEEDDSNEESEEEIEVSEDEDIKENEMNRESSELAGRVNANGDAVFVNGEDEIEEDEESDEEEEVEEIIEEYSEEEEDDSAEDTNDVAHLSSNGNTD